MSHLHQRSPCSTPLAERSRPMALPTRPQGCASSAPTHRSPMQQPRCRTRPAGRRQLVLVAAAGKTKSPDGPYIPPAVSVSKQKFLEGYRRPIPAIYNSVVQELLVQQHIMRYNKKYQYNPVFGLGFVSVFDQVLEGLPESDRNAIFTSYISALGEKPETYRKDAERLEGWAKGLSGPEALKPSAEGDDVQKALASIGEQVKSDNFNYNKFFAIGLFRLLELTKAKDPKALEALVTSVGVRPEAVNRDLMAYKSILSKLSAAKELLREMTEREKRKQTEREEEKKAKAEKDALAKKTALADKETADKEAAGSEKQPA